jgi:hypothetical protein
MRPKEIKMAGKNERDVARRPGLTQPGVGQANALFLCLTPSNLGRFSPGLEVMVERKG